MASNPNNDEFSGRGSRFIPDRLIGPGVIDQHTYVDKAKSRLHLREITPVPNYRILGSTLTVNTLESITTGLVQNTGGPLPGPGDILRIFTGSTAGNLTFGGNADNGAVLLNGTAVMHLLPDEEYFIVIPANAINFNFTVLPIIIEYTIAD